MNEAINLDHYVIIGGNAWAKGTTLPETLRLWLKHAGPRRETVIHIRQVDAKAYVDEMGSLHYNGKVDLPNVTVPLSLIKKLEDIEDAVEELLMAAEDATDLDKWYRNAPEQGDA